MNAKEALNSLVMYRPPAKDMLPSSTIPAWIWRGVDAMFTTFDVDCDGELSIGEMNALFDGKNMLSQRNPCVLMQDKWHRTVFPKWAEY